MKTQVYFPHAELKTITLLTILSLAFLFTLKGQEQSDQNIASDFKTVNAFIKTNNDSVTEMGNPQLAEELKSLMSSGAYWSDDEQDNNGNLTGILTDWMRNGLYWEENNAIKNDLDTEPMAVIEGE